MWGLLANIAAKGLNLWEAKKGQDAAVEDYHRKIQVNKALAAEQLAITYNSILGRSMEVGALARRKEFEIRQQVRGAEGQLKVQAASTGAQGKRVQLAQKQATVGEGERALASLAMDTKRETDNLIARAEVEERQTVNRLISSMPDVPEDTWSADILGTATGMLGDYTNYKKQQADKEDAIVLGSGNAVKVGAGQY